MSPWEYLEDWERSDRTRDQSTLDYINARMQTKFPGRYHVVKKLTPVKGWEPYYAIVFDDPAEETYLRLKWS